MRRSEREGAGEGKDDEARESPSVGGPATTRHGPRLSRTPAGQGEGECERGLVSYAPHQRLWPPREVSCAPVVAPSGPSLIDSHSSDIIHGGVASPFVYCSRFKTFYL